MTYEDCIEVLSGIQDNIYSNKFTIDRSDKSLIQSLAIQTHRGIAYTDRQLELVKTKINLYAEQLQSANINIDKLDLRMPLRSIDRSKYVKIIEENDKKYIRIRFPFQKKLIVDLDKLKNTLYQNYNIQYIKHDTHEHDFEFHERSVNEILAVFMKKDFVIDQELIDYNTQVEKLLGNKDQYLPGIYNNKIKNIPESSINYIKNTYGEPTTDRLYLYKDRRYKLGLHAFNEPIIKENYKSLSSLTPKIVERTRSNIFVNSNNYKFSSIVESILELNRFPLLVVLPEQESYDLLSTVYESFKNIVEPQDCSVMFRLDNNCTDHESFNMFVKDKKLNNPVAQNTKIVYTSGSKITKPLVKSKWQAETVLCYGSHRHTSKVQAYLDGHDLVIHYDSDKSPMVQFGQGRHRDLFTTSIEEV